MLLRLVCRWAISLETVQYLPAMRVGGGGVFGRLAPASYAGCGSEALGVPCPVFFQGYPELGFWLFI